MLRVLFYLAKRQFNLIDVAVCSLAGAMAITGYLVEAIGILVGGLCFSHFIEWATWGRTNG